MSMMYSMFMNGGYGGYGCGRYGGGYGFNPMMFNSGAAGLGLTYGSIFGTFLSGSIMQWGGSVAAKREQAKQVKEDQTTVNDLQTEYGNLENKDYSSEVDKADPSLSQNIATAKSELDNLEKSKTSNEAIVKQFEDNTAYKNESGNFDEKKIPEGEKEKYTAAKDALKTLNGDGEGSIAQAKTKKADAEKARTDKIAEAKQAALDAKKEEIKEAQKKLEDDAGDSKLKRKCDNEDEYNKICKSTLTADKDGKVDKKAAKEQVAAFYWEFSQYCKATDTQTKQQIAKKAVERYDNINKVAKDYITDDMTQKMSVMKSGSHKSLELENTSEPEAKPAQAEEPKKDE